MNELVKSTIVKFPFLKEIYNFWRRCNGGNNDEIYLVGGCIRDILYSTISGEKRRLNDFDFVLKNACWFSRKLADEYNLTLIPMEKYAGSKTERIVKEGIYYDFCQMKGEDIASDLIKRDFTINSIAVLFADFFAGGLKIIDPLNGADDLKSKVVKVSSDTAFLEDPLRMLRAYRIAGELGFVIDLNTLKDIEKNKKLILKSASERIRYELFKILELPDSFGYINKNSLIAVIFPELKKMNRLVQNKYHFYDLEKHSLKAYESMEFLINNYGRLFPEIAAELNAYLTDSKKTLLKFLAFFHDTYKPSAKTKGGEGEVHFYKHEKIGAEMMEKICKRLTFSNFETDFLVKGIEYHLRPFNSIYGKSNKGAIRFFSSLRDDSAGILLLTIADSTSKGRGKISEKNSRKGTTLVKPFLIKYFKEIKPLMELPKLINGNEIMEKFNLSPSPIIGKILDKTYEAQLSKEVKTKKGALKLAEKILGKVDKKLDFFKGSCISYYKVKGKK